MTQFKAIRLPEAVTLVDKWNNISRGLHYTEHFTVGKEYRPIAMHLEGDEDRLVMTLADDRGVITKVDATLFKVIETIPEGKYE